MNSSLNLFNKSTHLEWKFEYCQSVIINDWQLFLINDKRCSMRLFICPALRCLNIFYLSWNDTSYKVYWIDRDSHHSHAINMRQIRKSHSWLQQLRIYFVSPFSMNAFHSVLNSTFIWWCLNAYLLVLPLPVSQCATVNVENESQILI